MTDTTPTPVADALQLVDRVQGDPARTRGSELDQARELAALRGLADAVRSHGIGAELGQLRERRQGQPVEVGLIREAARSHTTRYHRLWIAGSGTMIKLTDNHSGHAVTYALEAGEHLAVTQF